MELRRFPIRGAYYLADSSSHCVLAHVCFGKSIELDQEAYAEKFDVHHCSAPRKPHARTFGTYILEVKKLQPPVPYKVKPGAIGFLRFAPPDL